MDRRRLTGLILLAFLVCAVGILTYVDLRMATPETPVAFAPAESANEFVAPGDVPIEPPAALVEVAPSLDTQTPTTDTAAAPLVVPSGPIAPPTAAGSDVAAVALPAEPASPPAASPEPQVAPPIAAAEPPAAPPSTPTPGSDVATVVPSEPSSPPVASSPAPVTPPVVTIEPPTAVAPSAPEVAVGAPPEASPPTAAAEPPAGAAQSAPEVALVAPPEPSPPTAAVEPPTAVAPSAPELAVVAPPEPAPAEPTPVAPEPLAVVPETPPVASSPSATDGGLQVAEVPPDGIQSSPPPADAPLIAAAPQTGDVRPVQPTAPEVAVVPPAAPAAPETSAPAGRDVAAATAPPVVSLSPPAATNSPPVTEVAPTPPGSPAPTFDVVRVEPSGEAVIAGLADPHAKVEVLDGPKAIAKAEANDRGEFALALEAPLDPGTHDLGLRTTSEDGAVATLSDQRVAVSVPDKTSKDVLVVLNSPKAPSKVLQVPQASKPTTANAPAAPEAVRAPSVVAEAVPVAPVGEPPAASTEVAAAPSGPASPSRPDFSIADTAPPAVADVPAAPSSSAPVAGPKIAAIAPAPEPSSPPAASSTVVTPTAAAPAADTPVVSVAAVEADTAGNLFVAGTTDSKEPVRVYVDGSLIGQTRPNPDGTWLLETQREMPAGTYNVRADQVDRTGEVIARAEVPFEREIEVAVLRPSALASATEGAAVSGDAPALERVIIKRGDNLWRIARETWGKGVRWSTIYAANKDQIRNPHWIYPGQVFIIPADDANWKN